MPIISTEELFGQDDPLTGNILIDKGNSNIPKNIVTTEELFGDAVTPEIMPRNSAFLPGRPRVENMIANRPNMGAAFKEEINQIPEGFIAKVLQPYVAAYKGLGALMQKGEAGIANPLMSLQEGNFSLKDLVNLSIQGVKGERSGELGDVMRSVNTPEPLAALVGLGGLAGLAELSTGKIPKPLTQSPIKTFKQVGAEFGEVNQGVTKAITNLANQIKTGVTNIRDYSANKVNAIRKGFWKDYAPQEWGAYTQGIENIPKGGIKSIQGDVVVQNLEKTLVNRGLMSNDGVLQKGFTPADNKLIKAYQNISRKWGESKNGELDIKEVIDEFKNIRGKYTGKPTPLQRQDIEAANDFFNAISDQINTSEFSKVKSRYRQFKENQQLIHEAIDLYSPEMKTAKGERFLTKGAISETTQGRKTTQMITDKTGQKLRGAKVITRLNQVNPVNWIKR